MQEGQHTDSHALEPVSSATNGGTTEDGYDGNTQDVTEPTMEWTAGKDPRGETAYTLSSHHSRRTPPEGDDTPRVRLFNAAGGSLQPVLQSVPSPPTALASAAADPMLEWEYVYKPPPGAPTALSPSLRRAKTLSFLKQELEDGRRRRAIACARLTDVRQPARSVGEGAGATEEVSHRRDRAAPQGDPTAREGEIGPPPDASPEASAAAHERANQGDPLEGRAPVHVPVLPLSTQTEEGEATVDREASADRAVAKEIAESWVAIGDACEGDVRLSALLLAKDPPTESEIMEQVRHRLVSVAARLRIVLADLLVEFQRGWEDDPLLRSYEAPRWRARASKN